MYFNLAGSLFVYQTMDAIDGKQARRTGTGSPLGELFDHGLDCIANAFFLPSMLMCLQAGKDLDKFNMLRHGFNGVLLSISSFSETNLKSKSVYRASLYFIAPIGFIMLWANLLLV